MSKIYGIPTVTPLVPGATGGGVNGKSAYELAVSEGYEGTLTEWLGSLVGPQGERGERGPQGATGATGADAPIDTYLPKDGSAPMNGELSMGGNRITGVGAPVNEDDAVRKRDVRPAGWTPTAMEVGARPDTWLPTADEVGARSNTWMPTAEQVGAATPAYVKRANPYNYLDNSDFRNPVNQRGATSYTGTSYKIDRWASYYSGSELTVNNGYISVRNNGVYQIVPFADMVFSAFACRTSGEIVKLQTQNNSSQGTTTVFLPTGDWLWAVLYEGEYTEEALPEYHPKGFAHELLECQRYYVEIDHYALGTGYSGAGNDVTIFLQTPIQMQAVPRIICDGAIRARYGGTEYYTLDSCRIEAFNRGYSATIRLIGIAISGITAFQVVAGYATSKFALSAEL